MNTDAVTPLEWERLIHLLQQLAELETEDHASDEPPACWW
jgi:hypothetical protein